MPESKGRKEPQIKPCVLESGIEVKPVYGPEDIRDVDFERDVGRPGEFPFTRGIHKFMYRARPWTMRQYAGFGTPSQTNRRFKYLIQHGQNALNVAFDLPTQNGLDSDDPRAWGEVGRVGMAVDTLADMEEAFDGIDLSRISTSLTINPVASIMICAYMTVARKQGVPNERIRGTTQNDILKEYIGRGTWIFPIEPSLRLIADTAEFCIKELPRFNPVSVCGYHIRESGATPAQEMAYALLIAKTYTKLVVDRGISPEKFTRKLAFNFDIHGNIWEQVAKFRAGRALWAAICRDEFGVTDPRGMVMRMMAGGGGGGLTREEPENNIVRGAYYALISALSGTQTMALCCYDEAYTIPSEKAALISLRTMQILAEEMGLCDTVDPLGGSYYVEWLTARMKERIVEEMRKIEDLGGIVKCIENGYIQKKVSLQAYETERALQSGEKVKVGVNKYVSESERETSRKVELHRFDPEVQREQMERLEKVKADRDEKRVAEALKTLRKKSAGDENLMPYILDCVAAYCTVGEMAAVWRDVFGEFREPSM